MFGEAFVSVCLSECTPVRPVSICAPVRLVGMGIPVRLVSVYIGHTLVVVCTPVRLVKLVCMVVSVVSTICLSLGAEGRTTGCRCEEIRSAQAARWGCGRVLWPVYACVPRVDAFILHESIHMWLHPPMYMYICVCVCVRACLFVCLSMCFELTK